jgi:hypothetical protein
MSVGDYLRLFRWARLKYNFLVILVVLLMAVGGFVFVVPLLYLFATNLFDVLGYFVVLRRFWGVRKIEVGLEDKKTAVFISEGDLPDATILAAYRVIQNMFDYLLFAFIWIVWSWKYALVGAVLKWFAWQDLLFYWVVKYPLPSVWTWLSWTPWGLLNLVFKNRRELKNSEVLAQAVVGLVIGVVLLFIF